MNIDKPRIVIYCDGACSGNQFARNVGGWGAILLYSGKRKEIYGGERDTTNQRMELMACIRALEQVKAYDIAIDVYSDSAYIVNCIRDEWYKKWLSNGWRNRKGEPVENRDMWEKLLELLKMHQVSIHKIGRNSGDALNETADRLARKGIDSAR